MNVQNRPSMDQIRQWIESGRLEEMMQNGRIPQGGSGLGGNTPIGDDSYQADRPTTGPFGRHRPAPQPLSLGSAEADSKAVEAMAAVIQNPRLLEAINSGKPNQLRKAVDWAAAEAAEILGQSFELKHPKIVLRELRRTLRRAVIDIKAGRSPLDSLAASLRHTSNFTMTTLDPRTVATRPAVSFDKPLSLGDDINKVVIGDVARILQGDTKIEVGDAKGTLKEFLQEASKAGDKKAYVAAVDAAAQHILANLDKADHLPDDEQEARDLARALHQVLFSSVGYEAQGSEADEALALALRDSGHFRMSEAPEEG